MAELYISRYDRHCLDKLLGTSTEDRLVAEGHVFTLSDGTEYDPGLSAQGSTRSLTILTEE